MRCVHLVCRTPSSNDVDFRKPAYKKMMHHHDSSAEKIKNDPENTAILLKFVLFVVQSEGQTEIIQKTTTN